MSVRCAFFSFFLQLLKTSSNRIASFHDMIVKIILHKYFILLCFKRKFNKKVIIYLQVQNKLLTLHRQI